MKHYASKLNRILLDMEFAFKENNLQKAMYFHREARLIASELLKSTQERKSEETKDKHSAVITLEVGHGPHPKGFEPGAVCKRTGQEEWKLNHICALGCKEFLEKIGFLDVLITDEDNYLQQIGWNNHKSDIFVSIHHNAFSNENAQGAEAIYHQDLGSDGDKKLAELCAYEFADALGIRNRGVKKMGLGVLKGAINKRWKKEQAVVLVEPYFITSADVDDHEDWSHRSGIALAKSINKYLKK